MAISGAEAIPIIEPAASWINRAGKAKQMMQRRMKNFLMTRLLNLLTIAFLMCLPVSAQEREPSRKPILRIETGMHTEPIWRVGVDAENLYMVTASFDKTVRVWELTTGRLLKTIRPPIGISKEGFLSAVAISPDGKTIAAAGWTGFEWDKTNSIYLFDRESGKLVRRLSGLPWVVLHLAYSEDGNYLVSTMTYSDDEYYLANTTAPNGGIRIYRTSDYSLVGKDMDYGDRCNGADFDNRDRLVTVSHDRYIRLYELQNNGSFRMLVKRKWMGNGLPSFVSFSPDGSKIAVGVEESVNIGVLSSKDLSALYFPDTNDITKGELSKVAWSSNGQTLYAGGGYRQENLTLMRAWSAQGRGKYRDIPVAVDEIKHIVALKGGSLVYGASDPVFGVIDSDDRVRLLGTPTTIDSVGVGKDFLLSADGNMVQFSYADGGRNLARFSIIDRRLYTEPVKGESLFPPLTEAKGISIAGLRTPNPLLNDKVLKLEQYETPCCIAVALNRAFVLLGTSFFLRVFDTNANERWRISVTSGAQAVNLSANGKYVVAALGDGTIRWYRLTDGKELLAFFPHADGKRWVLWTPSGYYDASPGGEDLIGWHINNDKDEAADFFPVAQFRNSYYRPDVISKVLKTGDEQLALREANKEAERSQQQQASVEQMLPPVVELISPTDNSEFSTTELTLRFRVRTPSGEPVTNIRILVDDRPASTNRELVEENVKVSDVISKRVSLPKRDSEVSIIAENRFTTSVPAMARLKWKGVKPSEEFIYRPKLYVLSIGISQYANPQYNLRFADKDATDFAAFWNTQKGLLYRDVEVKVLVNEQATKDEILEGLEWIQNETTHNDVAIIFFSGHGINNTNGVYYFLPYNTDLQKLLRTGVSFLDIKVATQQIVGKTVFFVDSCHAGNVLGETRRRNLAFDINRFINELSSAENGVIVFSSSTGSQSSLEDPAWNNGAFTKALVEGLSGSADHNNSGRVTINMLDYYISERVKTLTGGKQTPTTSKQQTQDFPIAARR